MFVNLVTKGGEAEGLLRNFRLEFRKSSGKLKMQYLHFPKKSMVTKCQGTEGVLATSFFASTIFIFNQERPPPCQSETFRISKKWNKISKKNVPLDQATPKPDRRRYWISHAARGKRIECNGFFENFLELSLSFSHSLFADSREHFLLP